MPNGKIGWKNGMMERWNIGFRKTFWFKHYSIIPSFQYSIIPE
jgi:hypothetical protein